MDRRLFSRVPVEIESALEWETKKRFGRRPFMRVDAITSDVSIDGARVEVPEVKGLRLGSQCRFVVGGAVVAARVLEIGEAESGGWLVRLALVDAGTEYHAAIEAFIPTESAEVRERAKSDWAGGSHG